LRYHLLLKKYYHKHARSREVIDSEVYTGSSRNANIAEDFLGLSVVNDGENREKIAEELNTDKCGDIV
jgi:hypothetical protein